MAILRSQVNSAPPVTLILLIICNIITYGNKTSLHTNTLEPKTEKNK